MKQNKEENRERFGGRKGKKMMLQLYYNLDFFLNYDLTPKVLWEWNTGLLTHLIFLSLIKALTSNTVTTKVVASACEYVGSSQFI